MKQPLSRSFLQNHPVRVIYNGVNRSDFHPVQSDLRQRYELENRRVVLAVASEWDERKGLNFLIEAAGRMGEGYRFVAIGLSEAQIRELPKGMIGIAHTESLEELASWYTTADCFANTTMEDNMPMVNLEALACGTPIAVFRTGGCPEALTPECGVVVPKGNVEALCEGIRTLCGEKPGRTQACLRRAEAFDAQNTFQAYLSLYKELLI